MADSRRSLENRKSIDAKSPKSPTKRLSQAMADANLTSTSTAPAEVEEQSTGSPEISKSAAKKAAKKEKLAAEKTEKKDKFAGEPKKAASKAPKKKMEGAALIGIDVAKEDDFSGWYQQVLTKGDMLDYYDVSGCYIIKVNYLVSCRLGQS
jgi:prolyl-tRNA synthetase